VKILAVITARAGSKRLPGKNIRPLGGIPLIVWSIDAGRAAADICDVLVSTDDSSAAEIARNAGALVPWLRPVELATDTATSADVCIHALDWYEADRGVVDGLLLLQPTSPFRSAASVRRGLKLFHAHNHRRIVGVSPAPSHPMRCYHVDGERMWPMIEGAKPDARTQDLPPAFVVNGAFFLVAPHDLRASKSFYGDDMLPLVMEEPGADVDIDTEMDWKIAELIAAECMPRPTTERTLA
jgi:CMP-N,N'-diacetyllegionaminic acid synthase